MKETLKPQSFFWYTGETNVIKQRVVKDNPLFQSLLEKPFSDQTKAICSDPNLFKQINPSDWVLAGKQSVALFMEVLANPKLASWVNNYPVSGKNGLITIATYTAELAKVALEKGKNVMSESDIEVVRLMLQGNHFGQDFNDIQYSTNRLGRS